MGFGLVSEVAVELHNSVELAAHLFLRRVIVPSQRGVQLVLIGVGEHVKTQVTSIVGKGGDGRLALHRICWGCDANHTISVTCTIIGKGGQFAIKIDLVGIVVNTCLERERLLQIEVNIQETV